MEQMLVTKGLNELKLLDSRIYRKINEGEFVGAAKISVPNVKLKISKEAFKLMLKQIINLLRTSLKEEMLLR